MEINTKALRGTTATKTLSILYLLGLHHKKYLIEEDTNFGFENSDFPWQKEFYSRIDTPRVYGLRVGINGRYKGVTELRNDGLIEGTKRIISKNEKRRDTKYFEKLGKDLIRSILDA